MRRSNADAGNHDWSVVRSSGLVVSLPVLNEAFPGGPMAIDPRMQRHFARAWNRCQAGLERGGDRRVHREWLDFILRDLLGLDAHLMVGSDIPDGATHMLADYDQILYPDAALLDEEGHVLLLVGICAPEQGLDRHEAGARTWRASPFIKLQRLMQETGVELGLLTNGSQFRLIFAPSRLPVAWMEWCAVDWADKPVMLEGFRTLLHAERFFGDEKKRLHRLAEESQSKQLELTDQLGEQVRQALEIFLRAVDASDRGCQGKLLGGMDQAQTYEMCLFTMMRLVFMLYAEERYLLPHGEMVYDEAYGLTHLWQQLSDQQSAAPDTLRDIYDAWPRLLATFRLIHRGCEHPDLNMRAYGGHLFDPERFPVLEEPGLLISNQIIRLILRKLLFASGRIAGRIVPHRLTYGTLDVEQIGTVYEQLLGYTVRRSPADQTLVVFQGGKEIMRPLDELEAVSAGELPAYVRLHTGWTQKQVERALQAVEGASQSVPEPPPGVDMELHLRLLQWEGFLKLDDTIPGGHLYVAHESGLRKGQGVYYTPQWITSYIVERTLQPLVYCFSEGTRQRLKSPREILDLKVCDPAMGSGAFLVQSCRYLAQKLFESWHMMAAEQPEHRLTLPFGEPARGLPNEVILPDDQEEALTWARRYVSEHCLYGVDINPLAVELARMSLWLVTLAKNRPFEFLDHKLRVGNSLIGTSRDEYITYPLAATRRRDTTDPAAEAALRAIQKDAASAQRKAASKSYSLGGGEILAKIASTAARIREIVNMYTLDVRGKEEVYRQKVVEDAQWSNIRRAYDAWCAMWFWPVDADTTSAHVPMPQDWQTLLGYLYGEGDDLRYAPEEYLTSWAQTVEELQARHRFFHWELEFPDVFSRDDPGFDAIVMNPPWERIKLQENEFFASRDPQVAGAPNAAARKRLIAALPQTNPALYRDYAEAKRTTDFTSNFISQSGHFPLSAVGDINTYPIFAELARHRAGSSGGGGMVIPSGIATDYYTSGFFRDLMQSDSLQALFDFENRERIFAAIDSRLKFCLLFVAGPAAREAAARSVAEFAFFMTRREHLEEQWRRFTLSEEDFALLNPNTGTCPIFRSNRDAELTKAIYRRHPVLIRELQDENGEKTGEENPWGISFLRMLDMANDSGLFRTREELEADGYSLHQPGNHFVSGGQVWLPLYEAKMIWHYDHRYASVTGSVSTDRAIGATIETTLDQHMSADFSASGRYWVAAEEMARALGDEKNRRWLLAFRDVTNATNERTFIASSVPAVAFGHKAPLLLMHKSASLAVCLLGNLTAFVFDFCARQKMGGVSMGFFIVGQLPVVPPEGYSASRRDWIGERVLELSYTAWDLSSFARDMGHDGPPFVWDEQRREQLRAQLDALYFHLYGIERSDVEYIMDTFPIVKRKDMAAHGHYRTCDLILRYYDDQAAGRFDTWHGPADKRTARLHER